MKENVGKFFEVYNSDPAVRSRVEENVAAYPGSYEIREALTEFALLPVAEELGLGFTLALTCLGFVRELIGNGTIFAGSLGSLTFGISLGAARDYSLAFFVLPAGGFLTLGLAMALVNWVSDQKNKKKQLEAERAAQNIENAKSALEQKGEVD